MADTTPPGLVPATQAGAWAAPAATAPGLCNAYLPDSSTLARFLWVVDYFARNGFYVVLDNQFNLDQTVLKDQALWLQRARAPPPAALCLVTLIIKPYNSMFLLPCGHAPAW